MNSTEIPVPSAHAKLKVQKVQVPKNIRGDNISECLVRIPFLRYYFPLMEMHYKVNDYIRE